MSDLEQFNKFIADDRIGLFIHFTIVYVLIVWLTKRVLDLEKKK